MRGLPRSEENHASNGMQLDEKTNILYVAQGGHTNAGGTSKNFAYTPEYALSAAILSVNLNAIDALPTQGTGNTAYKYNLPTLDDPDRANNPDGSDPFDPFGGNDGLNQAKIVPGGPVQIYSPGYRNAYDLVITKSRRMYTIDNGPNQGWGGYPQNEGTANANNNYVVGEPGSTGPAPTEAQVNNLDNLDYIGNLDTYTPGSYYGGHPNPTRANPSGAGLYTHNGTSGVWRTSKTGTPPLPADWPPVATANPIEGDFKMPGSTQSKDLLTFTASTNGMAEYTASNFGGALQGSLLACSFDGNIVKIALTADGTDVTNPRNTTNKLNEDLPFASGFGSTPLDIVAQGDNDVFPGSVWAITYGSNSITIFEPQDFLVCTGKYDSNDDDLDRYTNADEIDNATQPCSASSMPPDADGDYVSDLNDVDDDNDAIADNIDFFPLDKDNGLTTALPIKYDLFNNSPGTGLFGVGFTGLLSNKTTIYTELYDENNLIAGGAVGAFSIVNTTPGDALGALNTQENAFQFGVKASTTPFTVQGRLLGPFFNNKTPQNFQSQGIYLSNGDQDNYLKIALTANNGTGGLEVVYENAGTPVTTTFPIPGGIPSSTLDFFFAVNPTTGAVQPKYAINGGATTNLGNPIQVSGALLSALQTGKAYAVGVIATSRGATPFTATWDFLYVTANTQTTDWVTIAPSNTPKWVGVSVSVANKMQVMSGFFTAETGTTPKCESYDPATNTWTYLADMPLPVTHAGVATDGNKIYVAGGFTGLEAGKPNTDALQIYDVSTNTWSSGPKLPAVMGGNALVRVGRKLHSFGGMMPDRQTGNAAHYVLDLDNLAAGWSNAAPMPLPRCHFASAVVAGKIYALGGQTGHDGPVLDVSAANVYDPATNTWSDLKALPYARSHSESATFVADGKITLVGGVSLNNNILNTITTYDPTTDTWTEQAPLPVNLFGPSAEVIGEELFVSNGSLNARTNPQTTARKRHFPRTPNYKIGFSPAQVQLTATQGSTTSKEVLLWSLSGAPTYSIATNQLPPWLTVSPATGTLDLLGGSEVTLTVNTTSLSAGNYSATITATAPGYPNATLPVSLTVSGSAAAVKVLYLYGSIPPAEVDMKLSDTGTTGMSQFNQALKDVGMVTTEALDASITLNATTLNQYKVLILSSNNRRFTDAEKAAVATWVNAGGGLVAWSDGAFGGGINSTQGSLSDNDLTQQFGMQFLRDNGVTTFSLTQWTTDHYINGFNKTSGLTIEAEGASPIRTSAPATILAYMPACCAKLNSLDGAVTPADAAISSAKVGQGRVLGFFDRNAFWNAGPGTQLSRVDNKLFAQRLVQWASGVNDTPTTSAPTVSSPIADVTVPKNSPPTQLNLATVFADNGGAANLKLTVTANSDPNVVSTSLSGTTLTLTYAPNAISSANVTIRATDADGLFVEDTFQVTITNDTPPPAGTALYRVNAGGGQLTTSLGTFAAD
ncbi:Kelch repeat-containing protein, partial [Hymenobacter qilianensis]|uniref:Kelch repeat-containing protein n=1 Tax=Hymenobacter qilianensis TaxID=1385715 RepID=UPI001E466614